MWEAIRANARRSRLLLGVMGFVLVGLGGLIGGAVGGIDGIGFGAVGAFAIWLVQLGLVRRGGDRMILLSAGAKPLRKEDHPRLWNVTEEMTIAAGMGRMPRLYVVDDDAPNAFATGRDPDSASVAVTSGLLRRLSRDELQGVIAHEIGHIKNHDVRFMTTAMVMVGTIVILSDLLLRLLWYGGGRRRGKGDPRIQMALMVAAVVAAIVAPFAAQALYFACSRQREYLADASAARFTRFPSGLASALEKISRGLSRRRDSGPLRALEPLYIVSALQARGKSGLFASHPPVGRRIEVLRSMAGTAGLSDYENAYRRVFGSQTRCLGSAAADSGSIAAREATPEAEPGKDAVARAQEVGDLLDRMVDFLMISCVCGVRIKVPPGYTKDAVPCTRCGRTHDIPRAEPAEAGGAGLAAAALAIASAARGATRARPAAGQADGAGESPGTEPDLVYRRRGSGWESFRCACGGTIQVSPALSVSVLACRKCKRRIGVQAGEQSPRPASPPPAR